MSMSYPFLLIDVFTERAFGTGLYPHALTKPGLLPIAANNRSVAGSRFYSAAKIS